MRNPKEPHPDASANRYMTNSLKKGEVVVDGHYYSPRPSRFCSTSGCFIASMGKPWSASMLRRRCVLPRPVRHEGISVEQGRGHFHLALHTEPPQLRPDVRQDVAEREARCDGLNALLHGFERPHRLGLQDFSELFFGHGLLLHMGHGRCFLSGCRRGPDWPHCGGAYDSASQAPTTEQRPTHRTALPISATTLAFRKPPDMPHRAERSAGIKPGPGITWAATG